MSDNGTSPAGVDQSSGLGLGRRANPEARMPLMEHIRELRNRIVKIVVVVAIGAVVGWYLYPHVWAFIERPYCRIPQPRDAFAGKGCHLFVSTLFAGLFLKLKISIMTGIILTSPVWFYQLWAFIAPGLYHRERRWGYFFVGTAVPLFAAGGAVAYFAMTKGIRFLLAMVPVGVTPLITIDTYLSYALAMLAIFGVAFELPLVFVLLNLAGVLTHDRFRKLRRVIIFLVFAFAAVFTPSPDPISMLLLAVPCVVLVELSEIFVWANDRRRARLGVQFPGMTPEEISRYGLDEPLGEVDVSSWQSG
jgi:sec-independent protein translocase protein TatC